MNRFKIIVPVYNSELYIKKCIESILCQRYKNFEIIVANDASTDNTKEIVENLIENTVDGRIRLISNETNLKPLHNTINAIDFCTNGSDIIVIVDGDDSLKDEFVLEKLDKAYNAGYWMTHGSYEQLSNGQQRINKFDMPFNRRDKKHAVYHLRSFRRELYKYIEKDDLVDVDGEYFKITGDMALLFGMIEMLPPEKVKFFDEILYVYNDMNILNDFKLDLYNQERVERLVRSKKPYTQLEDRG